MNIQTYPKEYQASFNDLIYTIVDADKDHKMEVVILDSQQSETAGIKRFVGQSDYTVNVSNYVQQQFDITPIESRKCNIVATADRLKSVSVVIDNQPPTQRSWHTFGIVDAKPMHMLSDAPHMRRISQQQCDEISFIAPSCRISAQIVLTGSEKSFTLSPDELMADHNINTLVISMEHIEQLLVEAGHTISDFDRMTANLSADGERFIAQQYRIESPHKSSTRLCWINRYGTVDYYTALSIASRSTHTQRHSIYSQQGYKSIGAATEQSSTIISRYEPEKTMAWLGEIIAAPKVWIVDKGIYTPVNIRSQSTDVCSTGLSRMELSVSPIRKIFSQKN